MNEERERHESGAGGPAGELAERPDAVPGHEIPDEGDRPSGVLSRSRKPLAFAATAVLGWLWFYPFIIIALLMAMALEPARPGDDPFGEPVPLIIVGAILLVLVASLLLGWAGAKRPMLSVGLGVLASSLALVIGIQLGVFLFSWHPVVPIVVFPLLSSLAFLMAVSRAIGGKALLKWSAALACLLVLVIGHGCVAVFT